MGVRSNSNHPTTTKADGHLVEYFRQNFGAGGGGTNFTPQVNGHSASGGIINDYTAGNKIYRAHIFTSTDTFTVTELGDFPGVEYLLVAGVEEEQHNLLKEEIVKRNTLDLVVVDF